MKMRILAAAIAAMGISLASTAPVKAASVIYDWSGTCSSGCTGTATGVLTLVDTYTPGTNVSASDFLSWSYSSSSGSYVVPGNGNYDPSNSFENNVAGPRTGPLPVGTGLGAVAIDFSGSGTVFGTDFPGVGEWTSQFGPAGISNDRGSTYSWTLRTTPVPLPAGAPLVLTGLAGLAALRMRKKRKAQV